MFIKKADKKNKFVSMFNSKTGVYIRTGVLETDKDGKIMDTGVDPFMADFPELLDIGIMGSCIHGRKGLCIKSGVQCYQAGSKIQRPDMSAENFRKIVEQCARKNSADKFVPRVYQIALGGRGDPNKHAEFENILKICYEHNIVPNYTTSGLDLTDKEVELTKQYCGAVAVSEYRNEYTRNAIKRFIDVGMKTNIHYVLGNNTIDEAIKKLQNNGFDKGINAVIFLLHKPIGLGEEKNMLNVADERVAEFFKLIDENKFDFKIGFDSCCVPGLINRTKNINKDSFDTCEGGRWSAYIDSEMNMMPCSFLNDNPTAHVSLNINTVEQAWNSKVFDSFRNCLSNSCSGCENKRECMGGCPIVRKVVLCNRPEKEQVNMEA